MKVLTCTVYLTCRLLQELASCLAEATNMWQLPHTSASCHRMPKQVGTPFQDSSAQWPD